MIEIIGYFVLTAIFFLLFFAAVFLWEGCREWTRSYLQKHAPLLLKVQWDTLIKSFAAAGIILCTRKLLSYIPLNGITQTQFALLTVDSKVLKNLFIILTLHLLIIAFVGIEKGFIKAKRSVKRFFGLVIIIIVIILLNSNLGTLTDFGQFLVLSIVTPVVLLKMLCSGKYLGILTGFIVSYFMIDRYKKLKPALNKSNAKLLKAPVFLLLVFMLFSFIYFPEVGEEVPDKVEAAAAVEKSPEIVITGTEVEKPPEKAKTGKQGDDLLATIARVPLIVDDRVKYNICKPLIRKIARADIPGKKEIYQDMIAAVKDINIAYFRAELLKDLAVIIARSGDVRWALDITDMMKIAPVKFDTLVEIILIAANSAEPGWVETILPRAVDTVKLIKPRLDQANAFKKLALAAANSGKMKRAETIFQQALDTARAIKYLEIRDEAHMQIALALANTGNSQWAEEVARLITGEKIKEKTLRKIHRMMENQ